MNPPQIVRVLASVRLPSGHGPDVDYEIVQAVVRSGPDAAETREAVLLRLVVGDAPRHDRVAEILVQDLPAVQAQWTRFVQDVLWRRAQSGDTAAQAAIAKAEPAAPALPAISASGGRYGHSTGEVPIIPVKKEKKRTEPAISAGPRGKSLPPAAYEEAAFEPANANAVPELVEVIGFQLSTPPSAEGLMKPIKSMPRHLLVVAPMTLVPKVEDFVRVAKAGGPPAPPTQFTPIVIRRNGGVSQTTKKLQSQVAVGIAQMLGHIDRVLWITPE